MFNSDRVQDPAMEGALKSRRPSQYSCTPDVLLFETRKSRRNSRYNAEFSRPSIVSLSSPAISYDAALDFTKLHAALVKLQLTRCEPPKVAYIHRLPAELLGGIFEHCLPADVLYLRPFQAHAPLGLLLVCRLWKAVAESTPSLWSSLDAPASASPVQISSWIMKARALPLSLSLTTTMPRDASPAIVQHMGQCRSLSLRGFSSLPLMGTTKLLQHIDIYVPPIGEHGDEAQEDAQVQLWLMSLAVSAPSLSSLTWAGLRMDFSVDEDRNLAFFSRLTEVHILSRMSVEDCVQLLNNTPALIECRLEQVTATGSAFPSFEEPISRPNLRVLSIHAEHDLEPLFDAFTLPRLSNLSLSTADRAVWPQRGINEMFKRSVSNLALLSLRNTAVTQSQLVELLHTLQSSLKDLSLSHWDNKTLVGNQLVEAIHASLIRSFDFYGHVASEGTIFSNMLAFKYKSMTNVHLNILNKVAHYRDMEQLGRLGLCPPVWPGMKEAHEKYTSGMREYEELKATAIRLEREGAGSIIVQLALASAFETLWAAKAHEKIVAPLVSASVVQQMMVVDDPLGFN